MTKCITSEQIKAQALFEVSVVNKHTLIHWNANHYKVNADPYNANNFQIQIQKNSIATRHSVFYYVQQQIMV